MLAINKLDLANIVLDSAHVRQIEPRRPKVKNVILEILVARL